MNFKALITALVISGSSSVAMARPVTFTATAEASWQFNTRPNRPVVVRDHRTPVRQRVQIEDDCSVHSVADRAMYPSNNLITEDASTYKGPVPGVSSRAQLASQYAYTYGQSWMAITAPTRIDQGRQFVTDLPSFGRVSRVRLQLNAGTTFVEQVLVRYKDGSEQLVKLNARLSRSNPVIDLAVNRSKQIHGFVLYGASAQGSAYQILAL